GEAVTGNAAARLADVLAKREKRGMLLQKCNRVGESLGGVDLQVRGIGIDQNPLGGVQMFLTEHQSARNIDQQVGGAQHFQRLLFTETVVILIVIHVRPALTQSECFEVSAQVIDGIRVIRAFAVLDRIKWRGAAVVDVKNIVSEFAQAENV